MFCPCLLHVKDTTQASILLVGSPCFILSHYFSIHVLLSDAALPNPGNSEMESEGSVSLSKVKIHATKQNAGTGKQMCQGHMQKTLLSGILNGSLSMAENKTKQKGGGGKKKPQKEPHPAFHANRYLVVLKLQNNNLP